MTKEEIITFAHAFPEGDSDYPFEGDFNSVVLRRKDNRKWFGLIMKTNLVKIDSALSGFGDILNLKCPPELSEFLISGKRGVYPAYHMNKRLWISIALSVCELSADELKSLIETSFSLTAPKRKVRQSISLSK